MSGYGWKRYVATLCGDAWGLDAVATETVIRGIEDLIATERLSDSALADLLERVAVSEFAAYLAAPSIRVAIRSAERPEDCRSGR